MADFGAELRRRRLAAGLSLTALAERSYFTKGYLSKIENGKARPGRSVAEACDRALDAGGEIVALLPAEPVDRWPNADLPAMTRHFVGRTEETDRLVAALRKPDGPVVQVVTGLSGMGKTTLAIAAARLVAEAFPDGQLFVDLGPEAGLTPTAAEAVDRALRAVGVPGGRIPPDLTGRAGLFRRQVRDARVLLLLDDVATAAQIRPLLSVGAGCRLLVTSRRRLSALDDAEHLELGPLPADAAQALFRHVSGMTGDGPVDEIVHRCGSVPLAVRIVAARLGFGGWTAAELLDRLADRSTRIASMDDGERNMAAVLGSALARLADTERELLTLLAVHPGPVADVPTVAALADRPPVTAEADLTALHETCLVTREPGGYVVLHDLVRSYLASTEVRSLPVPFRRAAIGRLADHLAARVAAADAQLEPYRFRPPMALPDVDGFPGTGPALQWLRFQWPAAVAVAELAGDAGFSDRSWQLGLLLRGFFFREKLTEPWLLSGQVALSAADGRPAVRGMLHNSLGMAHLERGDLAAAESCHLAAAHVFESIGDELGATDSRSSLAWVHLYQGRHEDALRGLGTVLETYRRLDRPRNQAIALRGMAFAAAGAGRDNDAERYLRTATPLARTPLDVAMTSNCAGWLHHRAGRHEAAARAYAQAVDAARSESAYELARALTGRGNAAAACGDQTAAVAYWREADRQPVGLGDWALGELAVRRNLDTRSP